MRRTARHRAELRRGELALHAAVGLAQEAHATAAGLSDRMRASAWPRRALIAVSSAGLALSLVGLHDVSAIAVPVAPAPVAAPVVHTAPPPAPVVYTAPEAEPSIAPARDAYGITILPPPETPDRVSWPVPATTPVSSPFGPRIAPCPGCSTDHHGVDLIPGEGTPVTAVASGVVVEAAADSAGELGVHVVIRHTIRGHTVDSVYGHLLAGSMPLAVGDRVARAQQIGLVGSTGESTGPHLHFGVYVDGQAVDPIAWLASTADR